MLSYSFYPCRVVCTQLIRTPAELFPTPAAVEEGDWLVGEDLLIPDRKGLALRSMKALGIAYHFPELVAIGNDE